jgi:hypothetical protein
VHLHHVIADLCAVSASGDLEMCPEKSASVRGPV